MVCKGFKYPFKQHTKPFMLTAEDQRVKGYVWRFLPRQTVLPDSDGKCESFDKQTKPEK